MDETIAELDKLADHVLSKFQDAVYWEGTPTADYEVEVRAEIRDLLKRAYRVGFQRGLGTHG